MAIFKGAGVAIVTPMKENLEINYDKLDEMLEEQIAELKKQYARQDGSVSDADATKSAI